jgi:hypothetical protein
VLYDRNSENVDTPWQPNKKIKIHGNVMETDPENESGQLFKSCLMKTDFERTPKKAVLILGYKAISIDGEYSDMERFDIIDLWKANQIKLGFRESK